MYDYNNTMCHASVRGYIKIVKMMLYLGADDYNRAMYKAKVGGYNEIVDLIKSYKNKNVTIGQQINKRCKK